MKLRSDFVFWPQIYAGPVLQLPRLKRDLNCEVAIIGGGISGALMAYHLTREGIQVVLVDRHQPGQASTAASTALLQYEIDTQLVELIDQIGRERAVAAYQASVDALLAFEPLVAELGDDCALIARPSLYLASREDDVEKLRAEYEARRSMGIEVEFLGHSALQDAFNLHRPAALCSKRAYEIDPFRLTLRLLHRAIENGLEAFADTPEIVRHEPRADGVTLHTSIGAQIHAKQVIFATGYETIAQLPPELCKLTSTYAMVSEPLENLSAWPQRCLIWESARPYLYLRTTTDNRVMVGGEDVNIIEPHARDHLLEAKSQKLRERFSRLFPTISIETACAWAGTFAQTKDGLPYIGMLPQFPHSYFALGYGGNGITFSLLAAEIIRDLILRKANHRAELFRFDR